MDADSPELQPGLCLWCVQEAHIPPAELGRLRAEGEHETIALLTVIAMSHSSSHS